MDLSLASASVPHKLLNAKFRDNCVYVFACDVIASYLTDRRKRVKIGTQSSECIHAHEGYDLGSMLDSFSYNILTNDMFDLIAENVEIYNYEEDNTILCSGKCLTNIKDFFIKCTQID